MVIIKCPVCKADIEINIANAIDEHGEVFYCKNCGQVFRYAEN